ncbi:MAG: restriction endonuclease [Candidatus Thorarchaeota archaeon]
MTIPSFQECMITLLRYASDGEVKVFKDVVSAVADEFKLSKEDRARTLKHGQSVISNRVGWALHELKRAGLLEPAGRGKFLITPDGKEELESGVEQMDRKYLMKFEKYREHRERIKKDKEREEEEETPGGPRESMIENCKELRSILVQDVLKKTREISYRAFERLVVKLLNKMGYGLEDSSFVTGGSGDQGIDGIIWQDKLGLYKIYIQAKQWDRTVGDPVVTAFEGALARKGARKGILITTSQFSKPAMEQRDPSVVLVDGEKLAELMIDHGLGVEVVEQYAINEIDDAFFEQIDTEY